MTSKELEKLAECFAGWHSGEKPTDRQEQAEQAIIANIVADICTEFRHSKAMASTLDFKRACGVLPEPKQRFGLRG